MALSDVVVQCERALEDAKKRVGALPVLFGRFSIAEAEIAALKTAPDQADTKARAYALLDALNRVPPEHPPLWLLAAGLGSTALFLIGKVKLGGQKVNVGTAGLVTALGAGAVATVEQLGAHKPSSKDKIELDQSASEQKAEENRRETKERLDKEDTEALEKATRADAAERSKKRAKEAGVFQVASQPEFHPVPKFPDKKRFGYWKDGAFVEVPQNTLTNWKGRRGTWDDNGRFVPEASKGGGNV